MASTLTITSNFRGDHAGRYLAAALKQARSLEYMTMLENIKYKRNISVMSGGLPRAESGSLLTDRTCDFTPNGALTMVEKVLTPTPLQVNYEICKADIIDEWQALQMKAGQWNTNMGADFSSFLISHIAGIIADGTEQDIWTGTGATDGQFEGFMTGTTGYFTVDAVTAAPAITGGTYTTTNVITELSALLAAVPSAVYSNIAEDLYMYMNPKTYRMYINAVSAAGYVNAYSMNSTYEPYFEGCKIAIANGMADNNACVAQKSNLFFGTDLLSDETEIRVLDMADLDGSDNIRIVAKYSAGVQAGVSSDITWQQA